MPALPYGLLFGQHRALGHEVRERLGAYCIAQHGEGPIVLLFPQNLACKPHRCDGGVGEAQDPRSSSASIGRAFCADLRPQRRQASELL